MTLVLAILGRHTIWVCVDRRLSHSDGRPPIDDAIKVMDLETTDGRGVLAYAGLGATAAGTQPSDWMSKTLRGVGGRTFEESLGVLADAAVRELPPNLASTVGDSHSIVVPAVVSGRTLIYSIDLIYADRNSGEVRWRFVSHHMTDDRSTPALRLVVAGSGGDYLAHGTDGQWMRRLRRLVKANERGKVSDRVVADEFARVNYDTHLHRPLSVGARCIVLWRRHGRVGNLVNAGAAQAFYDGVDPDPTDGPILPALANGMDVAQLAGLLWGQMMDNLGDHVAGTPRESIFPTDADELQRQLDELDWDPDDRLR